MKTPITCRLGLHHWRQIGERHYGAAYPTSAGRIVNVLVRVCSWGCRRCTATREHADSSARIGMQADSESSGAAEARPSTERRLQPRRPRLP